MLLSLRSRFIAISVSISLLAVLLFASVIHERTVKYKHQEEIRTNYILEEHLSREIVSLTSIARIKNLLEKRMTQQEHVAQVYAVLEKNMKEVFVVKRSGISDLILNKIYSLIEDKKNDGKIKGEKKSYYWIIKDLPRSNGHNHKLLTIYSLSGSSFSEFLKFFGLPFLVSGILLCWIMVWASIILSSLFYKLEKHKQVLSDQAMDIARARDEAMQANLAKSNFLANMSHEIRTPLTSIIGFAESYNDVNQSMDERFSATKTIIKTSKHLMHIINDILDLSKVEAGKLEIDTEEFSILSLLNDIDLLVSVISEEKGIMFEIRKQYPLPKVMISDLLRVKQVLINLCSNAIKFTEKGYVYLNVSYNQESSKLTFDVVDTGVGLNKGEIEKIFKPFEQADSTITRKFGGTGLGLTISKNLIEMLNGTLHIESKVNIGSSFSISFDVPVPNENNFVYEVDEEKILNEQALSDTKVPTLEGKILIVEDNADIQELIKLLIKRAGLKYDAVENGMLAMDLALHNEYDLVFMDLQMPVMDGINAMKNLKQLKYKVPVVAMTANVMKKDRDTCIDAGFTDFVAKPIDRKNLYSVLERHIQPKKSIDNGEEMITSNLLNDDPDLIDLIDKFMSRLPEMQKNINLAHETQSISDFSSLIHQMKGVGGGYGYPILTDICAKIEFQVTAESRENVSALMKEFNQMVEEILLGKEENHNIVARLK